MEKLSMTIQNLVEIESKLLGVTALLGNSAPDRFTKKQIKKAVMQLSDIIEELEEQYDKHKSNHA